MRAHVPLTAPTAITSAGGGRRFTLAAYRTAQGSYQQRTQACQSEIVRACGFDGKGDAH